MDDSLISSSPTLFISDVHIGSGRTRITKLLNILNDFPSLSLHIVGDFIDFYEMSRRQVFSITPVEKDLIKLVLEKLVIGKLSWTIGNHEIHYLSLLRTFLGSDAISVSHYYPSANLRVLHGDSLVDFFPSSGPLRRVAHWLLTYDRLATLFNVNSYRSSDIFHCTSSGKRVMSEFLSNAFQFCENSNSRVLITGHIHNATLVANQNLLIANLGSWTCRKGHYLVWDGLKTFKLFDEDRKLVSFKSL